MATLERSLGRLDRPCLVQFALRPRTRFSEFCLRLAYYVRERNAGPFDSILSSGGDSTLAAEERVGGLVSQRSRLWRLDVRVLGEEEKNVEEVAAVLAAASGDDQLVPRRSSRRATRRYANRMRFADFGGFLPDLTQGPSPRRSSPTWSTSPPSSRAEEGSPATASPACPLHATSPWPPRSSTCAHRTRRCPMRSSCASSCREASTAPMRQRRRRLRRRRPSQPRSSPDGQRRPGLAYSRRSRARPAWTTARRGTPAPPSALKPRRERSGCVRPG